MVVSQCVWFLDPSITARERRFFEPHDQTELDGLFSKCRGIIIRYLSSISESEGSVWKRTEFKKSMLFWRQRNVSSQWRKLTYPWRMELWIGCRQDMDYSPERPLAPQLQWHPQFHWHGQLQKQGQYQRQNESDSRATRSFPLPWPMSISQQDPRSAWRSQCRSENHIDRWRSEASRQTRSNTFFNNGLVERHSGLGWDIWFNVDEYTASNDRKSVRQNKLSQNVPNTKRRLELDLCVSELSAVQAHWDYR